MIETEKLIAFIDGELDAASAAEIAAAIEADPAIAARVEKHRALRAKLASAFAPIAEEAPPQRLIDAARAPSTAERGTILQFPANRILTRRTSAVAGALAALAASFVVGIFVGGAPKGDFTASPQGLYARGALAHALDTELASNAAPDARVQIGLSFQDKDGDFCRTYRTRDGEGLACRDDSQWRIEVTARAPAQSPYRMAGSSSLILDAVQARIEGDAFDEAAEKSARDRGWRRQD